MISGSATLEHGPETAEQELVRSFAPGTYRGGVYQRFEPTVYQARTFVQAEDGQLRGFRRSDGTSISSDKLYISDIEHVVIPGGGRTPDTEDSTDTAKFRALRAVGFYAAYGLYDRDGRIAISGYKTPRDRVVGGVPEATSLKRAVLAPATAQLIGKVYGPGRIPTDENDPHLVTDVLAIDSVTNLAQLEAQGLLGPEGQPVLIASQNGHIDRLLKYVAPKVLRRPFMGLVVPADPNEPPVSRLTILVSVAFSQMVLARLSTQKYDAQQLLKKIESREKLGWWCILRLEDTANLVVKALNRVRHRSA